MMKFAMSGWTERQHIAALTTALIISLLNTHEKIEIEKKKKLICQFKLIN